MEFSDTTRSHCLDFFRWYNTEHRHSGIGLMTPADVHYGLATKKRNRRAAVLEQAYAAHPERFMRGVSGPPALPKEVWINNPKETDLDTNLDGAESREMVEVLLQIQETTISDLLTGSVAAGRR